MFISLSCDIFNALPGIKTCISNIVQKHHVDGTIRKDVVGKVNTNSKFKSQIGSTLTFNGMLNDVFFCFQEIYFELEKEKIPIDITEIRNINESPIKSKFTIQKTNFNHHKSSSSGETVRNYVTDLGGNIEPKFNVQFIKFLKSRIDTTDEEHKKIIEKLLEKCNSKAQNLEDLSSMHSNSKEDYENIIKKKFESEKQAKLELRLMNQKCMKLQQELEDSRQQNQAMRMKLQRELEQNQANEKENNELFVKNTNLEMEIFFLKRKEKK